MPEETRLYAITPRGLICASLLFASASIFAQDDDGETREWGIEGGSPNFLQRRGTLISVTFEDGRVLEDIPLP